MRVVAVASVLLLAAGESAIAQPGAAAPPGQPQTPPATNPPAQPPAQPPPQPQPDSQPALDLEATNERLQKLEDENAKLKEELQFLREDHEYIEEKVAKGSSVSVKLTGFLDVGFFNVLGDGDGLETDTDHENFPEYEGEGGVPGQWVFMGDPLSVAINARGEPANTGDSLAIKFDAIDAKASTFILNTLNLGLFSEIGEKAVFTAKLDVLPRGRDVSNQNGLFLGDFVDLRLAYLEYRLQKGSHKLDLFAGKFDSVVGFEYRSQEAPTRIEVTPSLICRYTCGYPIGVKARARFFDDTLVLNAAVTNGSQFTENFAFYNEIDTNQLKTVSGRLSYRLPFVKELEIGVSGQFGAQDNQPFDDVYQWLIGGDIHFHRHDFVFRAEYVKGRANGRQDPALPTKCDSVECLEFQGAYGLIGYRMSNVAMPYVRVDWRDALHRKAAEFVYISELMRATFGMRFTITENLIFKGEFTLNNELGRIPRQVNDIFTSSLVLKY
ncbi:MAG: outer membrane beta-barrel protein [Kofleriaceae bacterium]|nr:outer membrane beta-barrel protein [Kofleriaceae bacterium]